MFISPGGQFGRRYVIPMATRHIVQSSLQVQDGVFLLFQDGVSLACSFTPSRGDAEGKDYNLPQEKKNRFREVETRGTVKASWVLERFSVHSVNPSVP